MFSTTADVVIPGALGGWRLFDPMTDVKLGGRTLSWWEKRGLFRHAQLMLVEWDRGSMRMLAEHDESCVKCHTDVRARCPERQRLWRERNG